MATAAPTELLLRTKLYRPRAVDGVVVRSRLFDRLEQLAPLALVIAPAGYGKTTLLSTWLERCPLPGAWLTLDPEDSDLQQFVTYFVMAVRHIFPNFGGEILDLLAMPNLPGAEVIATILTNTLDQVDQKFVLILDDYHTITAPAVHTLLTTVLRYPPGPLHLVISARRDPPLPLTVMRLHGQMVEVRGIELAFTQPEVRQLLNGVLPNDPDGQSLQLLMDGTQGWGAGLQMIRLYLRQRLGLTPLAEALEGGARYALEYLMDEIFTQLPPQMRKLLLRTSILEQVSASACCALCDDQNDVAAAQARLQWLEANGVFTTALDERQEWFRYHPLFQQLLRHQLQQEETPDQMAAYHQRASQWCAAQGLAGEAIRHALASGDTPAAVRIIAQQRPSLMNREQWHQLERWLRLFPPAVVAEQPELTLAQAWIAQTHFDFARVRALLMQAEALVVAYRNRPDAATPDGAATLQQMTGEIETLRAFLCHWADDTAGVIRHGEQALALTPQQLWGIRTLPTIFLVHVGRNGPTDCGRKLPEKG